MKFGLLFTWSVLIWLNSRVPKTQGLIGYDCAGVTANITTVSLLGVGECNIPQQEVNVTRAYIQLVQINDYSSIKVRQCKVEIFRTIRRCGMHSHTMDVANGVHAYIDNVKRDACLDMYRYGSIKIGQTTVSGIVANGTITRPIHILGALYNDGSCDGNTYSDPYGTWDKVVVHGSVKISLRDYMAQVNVENNKIYLRSGTSCELSEGQCVDFDGGDTFWDPLPEDSCKTSRYGLLYEGIADRITDYDIGNEQTVYTLTEGDVTFGLASKNSINVCGYKLTKTEHPKLLIVETSKDNPFVTKNPIEVSNLDIFTYVNSKFVFVEKHIRAQLKDMYRDILMQRCNLERQILQTTLTIARISPDEFAFDLMKGPGYMAVLAGEVAHIAQCIPVEVKIARTTECYNELPVSRGNFSFHLSPRTHILLKPGTEVSCNRLLAPMYLLDGDWYSFGPTPMQVQPPTVLKPLTRQTWKYISPHALATSGIYTQSELDELRDHLMFPAERPAILNSIARGITGHSAMVQGGSISNLLDAESLHKIAQSAWTETWGYLLQFGNISAGIIGIMLICRGIKLVVDTVIHGYTLHTIYGWSIQMVGAVWDSVTNLLVHLGSRRPPSNHGTEGKDVEEGTSQPFPPPSYHSSGSPPAEPLTYIPIKYNFDPRIQNLNEIMRQAGSTYYTLPHPVKKEEVIPMRTIRASMLKDTGSTEAIYDPVPRPRSINVIDPGPSTSTAVHDIPIENTNKLYPELQTNTEATDEPSNVRNKHLFLVQKLKKDENPQ